MPCRSRSLPGNPTGRLWTDERGREAWDLAYQKLEAALQQLGSRATLYVVCGLQGAGKSTWIHEQHARLGSAAVFFDAALPSRRHRVRALEAARRVGARAVAVWIDAPLQLPSEDEGFREVIVIKAN